MVRFPVSSLTKKLLTGVDKSAQLFNAVRRRDNVRDVKQLVADLDAVDLNKKHGDDEETVLHVASIAGNIEIVQCLLDAGASWDSEDKLRNTALHTAAYRGSVKIARALVDKSPDGQVFVNQSNASGRTALHFAVRYARAELVDWLLSQGADPSLPDCDGYSAYDVLFDGDGDVAILGAFALKRLHAYDKARRQELSQGNEHGEERRPSADDTDHHLKKDTADSGTEKDSDGRSSEQGSSHQQKGENERPVNARREILYINGYPREEQLPTDAAWYHLSDQNVCCGQTSLLKNHTDKRAEAVDICTTHAVKSGTEI